MSIIGAYTTADMKKAIAAAKELEPKSVFIDPSNVLNYIGTRAKPSPISYAVLRAMALRAKPVAAIINTRLSQIARFTRRPTYEGDTGFRIVHKDPDHELTEVERKRAKQLEEAILATGFIPNKKRKDNFNTFVRKLVRDSLTLDAMTFELVYNKKGQISEWWAVDAATIEMVTDMAVPGSELRQEITVYEPVTKRGMGEYGNLAYIQRINGQTYAEFTEDELAYAVRNPRTDVGFALFGLSELETLIETVTGILNAENYNSGYFTNNNLPQGVLEIIGKYEQEHLEGFHRAWESLISGAVGKWKVPIMAMEEGQGLKFTPFKQNNRDMEFHQWLEFLTTITCAVYQTDPAEIGLKPWGGGRQGMINSDAEAARLENSKSKGFFPLMSFLADTINFELINRVEPEFQFEWVGLNEEDKAMREEQRLKRLTTGFVTIAEERAAEDKQSIEELYTEHGFDKDEARRLALWSLAPANPQLAGIFNQMLAGIQQEQQMQGGQEHEMQKLEVQYQRELEARGYGHAQAKEMAQMQAKQDLERMNSQNEFQTQQSELNYQRQLEQGALNRQRQTDMAQMQAKQDLERMNSQNEFQRQLEQGAISHQRQTDMAEQKQQFQARQRQTDMAEQKQQFRARQRQVEDDDDINKSLNKDEIIIEIELDPA